MNASLDLKKLARWAGSLYLLIFIAAGFAEGGVRASLVIDGDAAVMGEFALTGWLLIKGVKDQG